MKIILIHSVGNAKGSAKSWSDYDKRILLEKYNDTLAKRNYLIFKLQREKLILLHINQKLKQKKACKL